MTSEHPHPSPLHPPLQPGWIVVVGVLVIAGGLIAWQQSRSSSESVIVLSSAQFASATSGNQRSSIPNSSNSSQLSLDECQSHLVSGVPILDCPQFPSSPQVAGDEIVYQSPSSSSPQSNSANLLWQSLVNFLNQPRD